MEAEEPKMKCPFCSAEWSDANVQVYDIETSEGCDTCGYGSSVSGTIKITCDSCGRTMYEKEFSK